MSGPLALLIDYDLTGAIRCWGQRAGLSADDLQAMGSLPWVQRTMERDGFIVREGERPLSCAMLMAGCAFRQKVVREGSRQIVSFHFPGEFVDLQSALLPVNDHSVQALGSCRVATVLQTTLLKLVEGRPALMKALWLDTLVQGAIFREWVVNVGRRNARARIAHLLCELVLRLEQSGERNRAYELPITQEQLADATGLTSVHTNRTIQSLRKEGLISMAGGRLVVHDWVGLSGIGDFNDLYLHRKSA